MLNGLKAKPKKEQKVEEEKKDVNETIAAMIKEDQQLTAQEVNKKILDGYKSAYLSENTKKKGTILRDCAFCSGSSQLVVALESNFQLLLPSSGPLVPGHLQLAPIEHKIASTDLDSVELLEYSDLKLKISEFFQEVYSKKAIFLEFVRNIHQAEHFFVEALPASDSQLDQIYFTVLQEFSNCDKEWTDNKKVILMNGNSLSGQIPPGFSYIYVDFGDKGIAHVVENEKKFKADYAKTLIAECLGVEMLFIRKKTSKVSLSLLQSDYRSKWTSFTEKNN